MPYYNKLYPSEQMNLIVRILDNYRWLKEDEEYYNTKVQRLKEKPKEIRLLKHQTLSACESNLS